MSDAERRIEDLEVKVAFQEKLLADLDEVLRHLRDEIESVQRAVVSLTEEVQRAQPDGPRKMEDEVPPHY